MDIARFWLWSSALMPLVLMMLTSGVALARRRRPGPGSWRVFAALAACALACAVLTPVLMAIAVDAGPGPLPGLALTPLHAWMALLVQGLGWVIGAFSSRYLRGEPDQSGYVAAFAGVLAAVHMLLLADHWLVLIVAWSLTGSAMQSLLCFYRDRPFALLAAHKKRIADRLADILLVVAAALAWWQAGSGSFPALWLHIAEHGSSPLLKASAVCLALAVVLRTALFPVHGWLIQVMEAPTPVSALLHAGVVNLAGFVLVRLAPLLDVAPAARWVLVLSGLSTAVLAGLVMLTRVSVKVRLAWSTVAQMGFMVLECGLGLYTLAALHLIGHSLYKAHAFLTSSTAVRHCMRRRMRGADGVSRASVILAPGAAAVIVALVGSALAGAAWPWWWSGVLAVAWAPLMWQPPRQDAGMAMAAWRALVGAAMAAALTAVAALAHTVPLGTHDVPAPGAGGFLVLLGMVLLYLCLAGVRQGARWLSALRRWSYAGFYVDEFYTRLTLRWWPTPWAAAGRYSTTAATRTAAATAVR